MRAVVGADFSKRDQDTVDMGYIESRPVEHGGTFVSQFVSLLVS